VITPTGLGGHALVLGRAALRGLRRSGGGIRGLGIELDGLPTSDDPCAYALEAMNHGKR